MGAGDGVAKMFGGLVVASAFGFCALALLSLALLFLDHPAGAIAMFAADPAFKQRVVQSLVAFALAAAIAFVGWLLPVWSADQPRARSVSLLLAAGLLAAVFVMFSSPLQSIVLTPAAMVLTAGAWFVGARA